MLLTKQLIDALTEAAGASTRSESEQALASARDLLGSQAEACEPLLAELQRRCDELDRLRVLAGRDPLTGAANRRTFEEELGRELARHRRSGGPFAVLVIDLDDLKQRNDRHGHAAGDDALSTLTAACNRALRDTDLFARIGGDEFAVLLPGATHLGARKLASRMRDSVESTMTISGALRVSIGCASADAGPLSAKAIMVSADQDLYRDKAKRKHAAREHAA